MNLHLQISRVTNARKHHTYEEVNLIFPGSIAVSIEVSILPVGTRKNSKTDFGNIVVFVRTGLGSTEWTLVGATANVELVVVLGEWGQVLRFDLLKVSLYFTFPWLESYLDSEVDVGSGVCLALIDDAGEVAVGTNAVVHTDRIW